MQTVSDITAITPPSDPIDRPSSSNTEQISSDSTGPPLDTDLSTLDADLATLDADLARITSDGDLTTSDNGIIPPITIINASLGKRKKNKQKAGPVTAVVKKERARNFTSEEVQVIMQEAGKNTAIIKGRFTPTVTSEAKEKLWLAITKSVNAINGKGDRETENGRMLGRNGSTLHALLGPSFATLKRSSERLVVEPAQPPLSARWKPLLWTVYQEQLFGVFHFQEESTLQMCHVLLESLEV